MILEDTNRTLTALWKRVFPRINLQVQAHVQVPSPANNDHQGTVEQSRLEGGAKDVRKCEVHLVVIGLIDGSHVLSRLFHQWHKDQAHEWIGDAMVLDDVRDLLHECDGDEGDQRDRYSKSDNAFWQGELGLVDVFKAIVIALFIIFEDGFVDTVVLYILRIVSNRLRWRT